MLDAAVCEIGTPMIVTCVYAIYDPAEATLTYANAGHLPPLLTGTEGTRQLTVGDPPLDTGRCDGKVETVRFAPGERLTLYTDGLVEHRGSDIDVGIEQLRRVLEGFDKPIEALPGLLVDQLLPSEPDDDVAILVAAVPLGERGPSLQVELPAVVGSVPAARRHVGELLESLARQDIAIAAHKSADIELVTSELVSNAVVHGKPPVELSARIWGGQLIISVSDGGVAHPQPRQTGVEGIGGRGLHLIEALGVDWGTRPSGSGKLCGACSTSNGQVYGLARVFLARYLVSGACTFCPIQAGIWCRPSCRSRCRCGSVLQLLCAELVVAK